MSTKHKPIVPPPPAVAPAAPLIDTPEKLKAMTDTGKLPLTCTTCGWPVGSGATCEVDGTVAP